MTDPDLPGNNLQGMIIVPSRRSLFLGGAIIMPYIMHVCMHVIDTKFP